jgi:hypothetical protein
MKYYCNPINYNYRYQIFPDEKQSGRYTASREGADPSLICFQGRYYLYPSMTAGFLYSDDLVNWQFHELKDMPIYDYAPDVRVVGDYIYFCASNHEAGVHYRTKDPFSDSYERMDGAFPFWDPNLFCDDDGRIYFYWGSSTTEPLYGIELDRDTMQPIGERVALCRIDIETKGFERTAENHIPERSPEEIAMILKGMEAQNLPSSIIESARAFITGAPYMEGVWVNKHGGRYYLQYGTNGSRFNVYCDAVYVAEAPLGPYHLAQNNPYSYKPGGFMPGAGHGSTMEDLQGNVWHIATSRICINHNFERRVSLWPAGWDEDGELYCNQRFGDWPISVSGEKENAWRLPQWMLLSYGKPALASSVAPEKAIPVSPMEHPKLNRTYEPKNATDENILTWWRAAEEDEQPWLQVDLEKVMNVHAIQINFADDDLAVELPSGANLTGALHQNRYIDKISQKTRWVLEGSLDKENWFIIEDKSKADTDLPHDLVVRESGFAARYLRLTVVELPYGQRAAVSGLRVFGLGEGNAPTVVEDSKTEWIDPLHLSVSWEALQDAVGYSVEWGYAPEKLYHSYQVFENHVDLRGLIRNQPIYLRVTAFNEAGITEGKICRA